MAKEVVLGQHLLLQLTGCDLAILEDKVKIRHALLNCAQIANSTVVTETFHNYSPQGITGVVVIKESHISIHTWPEYNAAVVDFFSCNMNCDFEEVAKYLKNFFNAQKAESETVIRSIANSQKKLKIGSG